MTNVTKPLTPAVLTIALIVMSGTAEATTVSFATSFDSLPAGTSLFGVAALDGGSLHLTDAGDSSAFGAYAISLGSVYSFESFSATWKSLIGGGSGGGADGYSFNVASDLPTTPTYGNPGEEGSGTGLSVTLDTFDNGGGDVISNVQILWNGAMVAGTVIFDDDLGDGNYLRKNLFVDASLTLDSAGLVTFTYDGNIISATLPDYLGLLADQAMFGARTGAANDNHWIDDLNIVGVGELPETVVPEPTSLLLLGTGLLGAGIRRYRRRQ